MQKSRFTERHNGGTKRKLKSHQAQKKALHAFLGAGGCDFNLRFVPRLSRSVTRLFCTMTRLLQVTLVIANTARKQNNSKNEHAKLAAKPQPFGAPFLTTIARGHLVHSSFFLGVLQMLANSFRSDDINKNTSSPRFACRTGTSL